MINVDPNSLGGEGANWADPRDAGHGVLENNPAEALQSGRSGPGAVRRLPTSTAQGTVHCLHWYPVLRNCCILGRLGSGLRLRRVV